MDKKNDIRNVQLKILEIVKYIDLICRKNNITYSIMGGTALGAVRHGGFIPWDDDLDIFMKPGEYEKFKTAFEAKSNEKFVLQEWKTTPNYLEYSKVRMNGTAFIEEQFKNNKDIHQGIYVDIMILHKVPKNKFVQRIVYLDSKYVTLLGLSRRNWKPKSAFQKFMLGFLKILPNKFLAKKCYSRIYKYDNLNDNYYYCYWITPAKFKNGIFDKSFFDDTEEIKFEDTYVLGSRKIKEYLEYRYGDYMKLPSKEQQAASVHAYIYDVNKNYTEYVK